MSVEVPQMDIYFRLTEEGSFVHLVWYPQEKYEELKESRFHQFFFSTKEGETVTQALNRMSRVISQVIRFDAFAEAIERAEKDSA